MACQLDLPRPTHGSAVGMLKSAIAEPLCCAHCSNGELIPLQVRSLLRQ
jgi:hypothetical protein